MGTDYDRGGTARRILAAAGKHNADGELVGVAVGTSARAVEVDPDTMIRLLDHPEAGCMVTSLARFKSYRVDG